MRKHYDLQTEHNAPEPGSVMLGVSGGVDSSVAALLLKEAGHEVVGVTFWMWDYPGSPEYQGKENSCCSFDMAQMVAEQVDIPLERLDISQQFHNEIVQPTVRGYLSGETPNPCAWCNRYVRFEILLQKAEEMGFDYVATGHHVRKRRINGKYYLIRGVDPDKDQSYFLYSLGQRELEKALFPVGEFLKAEIYDIAEDHGLISAKTEESQDLCFVPGDDYRGFIRQKAETRLREGPIVDTEGNRLGTHEGLPFYTIGQRRGLGLETNRAYYVVQMYPEENRIVVGSEEDLYSRGLIAEDCQWTEGSPPDLQEVDTQIRYRTDPVKSHLEITRAERAHVDFHHPEKSVTPGQKAVFYYGERLLGGGTITECLR